MNNYKFTKENNPRSFIQAYTSLQDAQAFADSYSGGGWTIEDLGAIDMIAKERESHVFSIEFLRKFTIDFSFAIKTVEVNEGQGNRKPTKQERKSLFEALKDMEYYARLGDAENVRDLLNEATTGAVLTQAIKDEYLQILDNYINSI